jgi:hypothetical protein
MTNAIKYEAAVDELKTLRDGTDSNIWRMAEIAMAVEPKYGEETLQRLATDVGLAYTTLRHYRTTVDAWPECGVRPPFSVAYILNSHDDRLALIKKKPDMTKREAKKIMRELRGDVGDDPQSEISNTEKGERKKLAKIIADLKKELAASHATNKQLAEKYHDAKIVQTYDAKLNAVQFSADTFAEFWDTASVDLRDRIKTIVNAPVARLIASRA